MEGMKFACWEEGLGAGTGGMLPAGLEVSSDVRVRVLGFPPLASH